MNTIIEKRMDLIPTERKLKEALKNKKSSARATLNYRIQMLVKHRLGFIVNVSEIPIFVLSKAIHDLESNGAIHWSNFEDKDPEDPKGSRYYSNSLRDAVYSSIFKTRSRRAKRTGLTTSDKITLLRDRMAESSSTV
jgi:hypothetical protein